MKTYSAQELYNLLIQADESVWIEAKGHGDTNQSLMESVCSFSNEPGLGGGYILYGIYENKEATGKDRFIVEELTDSDKIQSDISTQCASMFNLPVRPKIDIEQLEGKNILKIFVPELPSQQKPLYFKNKGLPQGAWRRIGPIDQRYTEEDMKWLGLFNANNLSEKQKSALIFAREIGAVDTLTYSQLTGEKTELAEKSLEELEKAGVLIRKGKTLESTYYVLNKDYSELILQDNPVGNGQKKELKTENATIKYTENEKSGQKIMVLISENPNITTIEMANKLDMARSGVAKQIAVLQKENLIRRVGPDKGGHWEIIKSTGDEK